MKKREFIKKGIGLFGGISLTGLPSIAVKANESIQPNKPLVISTWDHGLAANKVAWQLLEEGGAALDAVQQGVMKVEEDPNVRTVGIGGRPDREGRVTLDACIMDHKSRCGSVAFLENIVNPIAVARDVMEKTPHVMLVGDGALQFALSSGFSKTNLLTSASKKEWEDWKKQTGFRPAINIENHDTISSLAIDKNGRLSGACTTSGAAWKMNGRVGDSPIIGAGLFVDGEVGAAAATGLGEAVIRTAGSAMVVEAMRNGKSPQEACELIVDRIINKHPDVEDLQVGFVALDKHGNFGAFSIHKGFSYAVCDKINGHKVESASSIFN
ncbi:MAG: N(4)-(beta-N-acetylglucosaminyl)-L-asparaginase [Cyclobacteriaceae bacterium]